MRNESCYDSEYAFKGPRSDRGIYNSEIAACEESEPIAAAVDLFVGYKNSYRVSARFSRTTIEYDRKASET